MSDKKLKNLHDLGFENLGRVSWNMRSPALYEEAVMRREGLIAHLGALVVRTGTYTGRSPRDKFIVADPGGDDRIWWGDVNNPFETERYDNLRQRVLAYMQGRDLFVQDLYAGADPNFRINVRVVTESAWHALFIRNMLIRELEDDTLENYQPEYTLIHAPYFRAIPEVDGTRSEVFVVVNYAQKEILIGGTAYAGEMKKAVFTVMTYLLPEKNVLSMHCSANYGAGPEDTALFFGLSGTGKTTLAIDPTRTLVGDDEHGWSDAGVFNIEGGCYAKVIRVSADDEPEVHASTRRFGTILENVRLNQNTRRIDLDDAMLTENTRASFPISHLENATRTGLAGHPKVIFFLTADAFGVLPPLARLSVDQAIYYFLLGYTAKVAGTERGIQEPQATFSACFGAPFMALSPVVYARLLGEKVTQHGSQVWLVNTGWTGGSYGLGERVSLPHTRAMVQAVLRGDLDGVEMRPDPAFGLMTPVAVPGVPDELLLPRNTWHDPEDYDATAKRLIGLFQQAFEAFAGEVNPAVKAAAPAKPA